MKKVLLILLALFSLIALTSCGKVKAKELKIDGSKAEQDDLEEIMDKMNEYLEENEFKNKWYSLATYESISYDETTYNGKEVEDFTSVTQGKGSYYYSKFAYEQKMKYNITITVEYKDEDGEKYEEKTEVTYIYIDGKEYCKEVRCMETENSKSEEVFYSKGTYSGFGVAKMQTYLYGAIEGLYLLEDLYKEDGMFAGETEIDKEDLEGVEQAIYKFDKDTYQLKLYKEYSYAESDEFTTTSFLSIKAKAFGFVTAPKNAEKYN